MRVEKKKTEQVKAQLFRPYNILTGQQLLLQQQLRKKHEALKNDENFFKSLYLQNNHLEKNKTYDELKRENKNIKQEMNNLKESYNNRLQLTVNSFTKNSDFLLKRINELENKIKKYEKNCCCSPMSTMYNTPK
jgi:predicted nuclease with TOPRIM domain